MKHLLYIKHCTKKWGYKEMKLRAYSQGAQNIAERYVLQTWKGRPLETTCSWLDVAKPGLRIRPDVFRLLSHHNTFSRGRGWDGACGGGGEDAWVEESLRKKRGYMTHQGSHVLESLLQPPARNNWKKKLKLFSYQGLESGHAWLMLMRESPDFPCCCEFTAHCLFTKGICQTSKEFCWHLADESYPFLTSL